MESREQPKQNRIVPTASAILDDGTIVEMVYRPDQRRTFFVMYSAGRWTVQDAVDIGPDLKLVPFSPNNNLIKNEVVLLPSEPRIYGSEAQLVADIRTLIHRYVDFGESFENVATHYVLLTWVYDAFNELPSSRAARPPSRRSFTLSMPSAARSSSTRRISASATSGRRS